MSVCKRASENESLQILQMCVTACFAIFFFTVSLRSDYYLFVLILLGNHITFTISLFTLLKVK